MNKKILPLIFSFFLVFSACSKKDESTQVLAPKSNKLTDSTLLKKLPSDTFAFAVLKTGDEQFKRYNEILGSEKKIEDLVKTVSENSPQLEGVAKDFSQLALKLIPTSRQSSSKTDLIIFFASGNSTENIALGFIGYSAQKDFYKNEFAGIAEGILKTAGNKATKNNDYKLSLSNNAGKKVLFLEAGDNIIVASGNEQLTERLLKSEAPADPYIPQSARFQLLRDQLDNGKKAAFTFSYVDLNRIYTIVPFMAAVPEKFKALLTLLPEEIATNAVIDKSKIEVNLSAFISEQGISPEFRESFSKPSATAFFNQVDTGSALAVSLNTRLIKNLADYALSLEAANKLAIDLTSKINSGTESGLLLNANPKAGLADLAIFLPFTDADWAINAIKNQADLLSKTQGINANWNSKDINGRKVDYLMSPFGIGIYLLKENDYLVAGISESSIASATNAISNKASDNQELGLDLSTPATIFKVYVNHLELYNMILGIKNFASVFTGTQGNQYFSGIEDLKKFKFTGLNSSYKNNLLTFEGRYVINEQGQTTPE